MFKHSADRLPVALILAVSALDVATYLIVENTWLLIGYWLLLVIPKGVISAWNHHHQHVHTFRSNWLNRPYEILLALHTGITTNLWLLHHNLGHHLHFLDQSADESGWQRRDGTTMNVVEYSLTIAATAYYRAFRVGKRHKKHQRIFLIWTGVTVLAVAALMWVNPLPALFVFVLPMVTSLLFTSWVTYDHHSGLETKEQFEASYNIRNRAFNVLTGNLGYHTAHHFRQAVHWSKLPALHEQIAERIPDHLYRRSTFDVFFPRQSRLSDGP